MTLTSKQKDKLAALKETTEILVIDKPIYLKEHEEHLSFVTNDVVYMVNMLGRIVIRVCSACGYEDVTCLHIHNKMNFKELQITCLLCGDEFVK